MSKSKSSTGSVDGNEFTLLSFQYVRRRHNHDPVFVVQLQSKVKFVRRALGDPWVIRDVAASLMQDIVLREVTDEAVSLDDEKVTSRVLAIASAGSL